MKAAGVYTYWCNDEQQPAEEPWSLQPGEAGHVLRGQRLFHGNPVLDIEAQYLAGQCFSLKLSWHAEGPSRTAYYRKNGNDLHWRFSNEKKDHILPLSEGSELFPILRVGTGPLVPRLDGARHTVVMPNLRSDAGQEILKPVVAERHSSLQSCNNETTHYRYNASEFGAAGSDCWIDDRGLLHRLRWKSGTGEGWEVRLANLEADRQFKGFGLI